MTRQNRIQSKNKSPVLSDLIERISEVQGRIDRAAHCSGRSPADITLIAVTKSWPISYLAAAYHAGLRHFGENRTHELVEKRPKFEDLFGLSSGVIWHFIGHLQSRQSEAVADYADIFHAADRRKIINRLGRQVADRGRILPLLLEVNVSGEETKSGFDATDWENNLEQRKNLIEILGLLSEAPALSCRGLMTMAPWQAPPDFIRAVFRRTRQLREFLEQNTGQHLPVLSMGMTDDFELAIEEGATHVRIGRALFGERQT